jgi:hypothetical protein
MGVEATNPDIDVEVLIGIGIILADHAATKISSRS